MSVSKRISEARKKLSEESEGIKPLLNASGLSKEKVRGHLKLATSDGWNDWNDWRKFDNYHDDPGGWP